MAQRASTKSADPAANQESAQVVKDLHERMVRIRLFETEAGKLMEAGRLPGFLHLYVGQEAVAAGVMAALRDDDQITSTHRGHGHCLAKGLDRLETVVKERNGWSGLYKACREVSG